MAELETGIDCRLSCEFLCITVFNKFPLISFMYVFVCLFVCLNSCLSFQ